MKVALIGRPNVGKSTLFNRLVGQKKAIVGDLPGITRDRKYEHAELYGLHFEVLDTPGVDTLAKDELAKAMNYQSQEAVAESDIVFFVLDAIDGITEYDKEIARWLRSAFKKVGSKSVLIIKNKCEGKHSYESAGILGFGEEISISAEHNLGFNELYERMISFSSKFDRQVKDKKEDISSLKVAIIGRPNVGKSTLINSITGSNRLVTGNIAGITRDSISLSWKFKGRDITLIDTAGQRKKSKVQNFLENVSVIDAWKHIKQTNVAVVLMDINNPFEKQDITIARKAFDEGKVIIFALNKSDTVVDAKSIQQEIERRAKKEFSQLLGVPCLLVSAKEKLGLARIFNVAIDLYDKWSGRISTNVLNRWFELAVGQNPPPLVNRMPIKLKYISQVGAKPPTFAVFANRADHLPVSYERYLMNHLRKSFALEGVPLRIFVRQRENPFA
ncbi:MAG: ribosome biogenesis GTPase Der [Alphaproteobacteria bacterium]|nr:ribosome biogenesis GTPase Der [Alphaproteobacteria bacterium]